MGHMCQSHNLGSRVRRQHVRLGVLWFAVSLVLGFGLVERGDAGRLGFLLALPLAIGCYCLLAGSFGVCVYNSVQGRRLANHGAEVVPDETLRKRLVRRGLTLAGLSCTLGGLGALAFVVSV